MRRAVLGVLFGVAACTGTPVPGDAGAADAAACLVPGCRCPAPGTYADLALAGTTVTLRVPAGIDCDAGAPLLVELVGANDDGERAAVEALAEEHAFFLARPALDAELEALVPALVSVLPIDASRLDLVGSGDGARTVARVLHEGALVPRGVALVDYEAPVAEASAPVRDFGASRPRVYLSTGERARGIAAHDALARALAGAGFDGYALFVRERDSVEATPGWLFTEAWRWLALGAWPENGVPQPAWVRDPMFPAPETSMLSVDAMPDATLVAGSADGRVFGTNESLKWSELAALGPGPLVGVVAAAGAPVLASTEGLARSADGAAYARDAATPDVGAVIDVAWDGTTLFGATRAALVRSEDRGATWSAVQPLARASAVAVSSVTGTVVAVGLGGSYLRAPRAGAPIMHATSALLHDVAAGPDGAFWAAGAAGTVLRSIDDGITFDPVLDPEGRLDDDLYTVDVGPDGAAIAAGARGAVAVSHDGASLVRWPVATEDYVAAVRWLEPGRAIVLGQHGLVAIRDGL